MQKERERVQSVVLSRQSTAFNYLFIAFNKQVIGVLVIGVLGIKISAKEGHHEPPYIKAFISATQKISKQFAIEKGGEVNPKRTRAVCKQQYTSYQLSNDHASTSLSTQYTNDRNKREHTKYKLKPPFKLQFW